MSEKIQRWRHGGHDSDIYPYEDGDWYQCDDVDLIIKERDELKAENEQLKVEVGKLEQRIDDAIAAGQIHPLIYG